MQLTSGTVFVVSQRKPSPTGNRPVGLESHPSPTRIRHVQLKSNSVRLKPLQVQSRNPGWTEPGNPSLARTGAQCNRAETPPVRIEESKISVCQPRFTKLNRPKLRSERVTLDSKLKLGEKANQCENLLVNQR